MKLIKNRNGKKMKLLVILGIIILPLVYSLFYLKGFWDPYNSLENISVALVNLDECKENCRGEELIEALKEDGTFDFKVVSEKKADKGLVNKDYYAVIKIPKDFTSSLNNASSKNRSQATLTFSPNTKTNYLASQIIGTAVSKVQANLQSKISKEVVSELVDNLQEVPNQTQQISTALGTIQNGTSKLNSGSYNLYSGINTLNTSYKTFNSGVEKLATGSNTLYTSYQTLDSGINTLYDSVHNTLLPKVNESMSQLTNGVINLKTGSNTLTNSSNTYKNSVDSFVNNAKNVYTAINTMCSYGQITNSTLCQTATLYTSSYATLNSLCNAGQITNQEVCSLAKTYNNNKTIIDTLNEGTNNITSGINQVNSGINTLSDNLSSTSELTSGLTTLDENILKLKNGSSEVLTGIASLNSGINELNNGSSKINSGLNSLSSGSSNLNSGINTLNEGVKAAKTEVDKKISETNKQISELNGLDDYTASSVKVKEKDYGNVKDYGTFFSPYFMSLSLWVGGILILMGLYYDPDHRFKILGRNSENRGKRLVLYNLIGVAQAILLAFTLQLMLGFEVTNYLVYYGSCILISEAFLAIIMFLFFNFQDIGKFLSLVLLVLQLASCGGTFPVETEPALYQAIYPYMPMTYSVDLLRESFVSINSEFLTKDIIILAIIFIVFNALIFITSHLKNKLEKKSIKK